MLKLYWKSYPLAATLLDVARCTRLYVAIILFMLDVGRKFSETSLKFCE